jgi:hypothetical protein
MARCSERKDWELRQRNLTQRRSTNRSSSLACVRHPDPDRWRHAVARRRSGRRTLVFDSSDHGDGVAFGYGVRGSDERGGSQDFCEAVSDGYGVRGK